MKERILTFAHPVKVLQVYKLVCVYDKDSAAFELRKDFFQWRDFASATGFVADNKLFLPDGELPENAASTEGLIILENTATLDLLSPLTARSSNLSEEDKKPSRCFWYPLNRAISFEVFKIRFEERPELYLHYNYFRLGEPQRDNFLITQLKLSEPVEIKLNGKTDASLTSRRARVFKDQYFLFDYIGEFPKATLLSDPVEQRWKHPPQPVKTIDLLKPLW